MHGSEAHSLGQNRWKICIPLPPLPSPPIKDGKLARFGFCAASSLICRVAGGGDGGLLFHFIRSKIAGAVSRGGRMVMM